MGNYYAKQMNRNRSDNSNRNLAAPVNRGKVIPEATVVCLGTIIDGAGGADCPYDGCHRHHKNVQPGKIRCTGCSKEFTAHNVAGTSVVSKPPQRLECRVNLFFRGRCGHCHGQSYYYFVGDQNCSHCNGPLKVIFM